MSYPGGLGLDSGVIGRDGAGRVTSVEYQKSGQHLADYALAYDGLRSKQRVEGLSGVQLDYGFDSWNRLTGMVWSKGGATLDGQQRNLDLGNRVVARQRAMDATGEVFSHDGHHRMTAWWQGVPNALSWTGASDPATWTEVERYTLDAVLARQQTERQSFGGSPATTAYAQNAAHFTTQVGAESRTVHEGFLNGDGTFYYRWDAWGRLTEVREVATGLVRRAHLYDAEGRRVLETEVEGGASKTTRYVFWGRGLAASYDLAGGNTRTYGFVGGADGEAFVRVQQGAADDLFELARDFQGSVLALIQRTNPSSVSVAERYRYEPFGKVAIEDGSGQPLATSVFGNERFFLGRIWDEQIGLYDVRARWYEPDVGAFLAPDPLGAIDSWNRYQYGLAEPNSVSDPMGLQSGPADFLKDWNPFSRAKKEFTDYGKDLADAAKSLPGAAKDAAEEAMEAAGEALKDALDSFRRGPGRDQRYQRCAMFALALSQSDTAACPVADGFAVIFLAGATVWWYCSHPVPRIDSNPWMLDGEAGSPPDSGLTKSPEKVGQEQGMTPEEVRNRIHKVKKGAGLRGKDVLIDPKTGEVYPVGPGGKPVDSVGNIHDV